MKIDGQCTPTGGRFFYLLLFLSVPAPLSQALGIMVFNHISSGFAPAGCTAVDRDKAPALEILHIFTTGNAQRTVIYKSCRDIIVFYSIFIAGDAGRIGFCRFRAVTKIRCLTCLKGFPSKPGISLGTRPRKGNAPESFFAAQGHSKCMSRLEAAADHGVNVFIYDWYWYDRRPFLENCLNDGFLKAKNNGRMKFYLMWANHDAMSLWDKRNSDDAETVVWLGSQDRAEFEKAMRRIIDKYFTQPNYYTIDGKPVFMIYDVPNLVKGLGGIDETRRAVDWLRETCVKAGLAGLHLQFTMWNERFTNVSGVDGAKDVPAAKFDTLGFDSCSHYQYVHFTDIDRNYEDVLPDVEKEWRRLDSTLPFPYFPHVSLGWDNNPRLLGFRPGVLKK